MGQWTVGGPDELEGVLDEVAEEVGTSCEVELAEYLAHYGYVVEAHVDDVEAWSVTLAPDVRRLLQLFRPHPQIRPSGLL